MTRIKICGITNLADALHAARCGASAIGFVFYNASPRYVEPSRAREIARALPPFVSKVALFVNAGADEVNRVLAEVPIDLLQFHGEESAEYCAQIQRPYLKAVRMRAGVDLLQYARDYSSACGLLVDAYVEGNHGGTGVSFDWNLLPSSLLASEGAGLALPLILSGGLTPENVAAAITRVRPWAVDVSSGVEAAKGKKDPDKVSRFVQGVRDADARLAL